MNGKSNSLIHWFPGHIISKTGLKIDEKGRILA